MVRKFLEGSTPYKEEDAEKYKAFIATETGLVIRGVENLVPCR